MAKVTDEPILGSISHRLK